MGFPGPYFPDFGLAGLPVMPSLGLVWPEPALPGLPWSGPATSLELNDQKVVCHKMHWRGWLFVYYLPHLVHFAFCWWPCLTQKTSSFLFLDMSAIVLHWILFWCWLVIISRESQNLNERLENGELWIIPKRLGVYPYFFIDWQNWLGDWENLEPMHSEDSSVFPNLCALQCYCFLPSIPCTGWLDESFSSIIR